jgi:P-type Ca2+ transporter type 2C
VRGSSTIDAIPQGLSNDEARRRFASEGPNELPRQGHRNAVRIAYDVLREPMFMFLVGAGAVYLLLGELSEALLLSAFATTSVVITVVQEYRSERVLEALADLTSPRALVIRDHERRRIAGRDVVRGDVVIVSEGDRVPADCVLVRSDELAIDESLLTGESVPVRKSVTPGNKDASATTKPGGDDTPYLFSGTLVVRGQGFADVSATGPNSEIGKIGTSLAKIEAEPPRLKAETARIVQLFAIAAAIVCSLAVILQLMTGHGWLQALLAGIALGMAMLPEEFPLVLTVFMVMGAWRISQARVLTRRASAIEALGEATVLCTDKTGTLTENRMTISELRLPNGERFEVGGVAAEAPTAFHDLVSAGALASQAEPVDPMDVAFVALAKNYNLAGAALRGRGTLERTHGLTPTLLAVTNVWREDPEDLQRTVAAKGAPEAIAALCRLAPDDRVRLKSAAEQMAREGLRVLAVAKASMADGTMPSTPHGFDFTLLGLVGLADPLRSGVPDAVRQCQSAGIRVVMITGDYPATAVAIARSAGIDALDAVSGDEVEKLDRDALRQRVRNTSVFARIAPAEKLRIVEAFQANGDIVAMTGDGVNDAPSLKAAQIGIAMGGRGTDVAREASALVLLDDDFGSIVRAIRLGRRIFDNLRKAMGFILAIHVPIAGLALFPLIVGLPPILEPVHIAFLELIIDPVCSIAFENEPEDEAVMSRPPRAESNPLLPLDMFIWSVVQGLSALVATGALYVAALNYGLPADQARAVTFGALIASTIALVLVNRTSEASPIAAFRQPNPTLWAVLAAATALFAITLRWPPARRLFHFGEFHDHDILIAGGVGLALLLILEHMKLIYLARVQNLDEKAA